LISGLFLVLEMQFQTTQNEIWMAVSSLVGAFQENYIMHVILSFDGLSSGKLLTL